MGHAEPHPGSPNDQDVPDEMSSGPTLDEEKIEKSLIRKIDLHILPIVVLLYLFSFLDRVNIGNARLYGLEEDLGLVGNQYQVSVSILFVTYCFFEVPSNLVLKKLRPSRYIATISVMWGIIATLTGITQNYGGLIACRILLGVVEAGLFPGFITYLTLFYSKREIALRTSYLFSSAAIAGAFGGLLAYGIGFMDGICGLRGWRWIMIIEGIPTVLLGVVTWFVLADDPDTAYYLNKEERALVTLRRSRYIGQTESAQKFHWADVKEGVLDWKIWAFSFGQFGIDTMLYGYSTFLPTIIKGMGKWTTAEVQALTIPCYGLGAIAYLSVAWLSDRTQHRAFFICLFCAISVVGYGILISDSSSGVHYFGALMVALGLYVAVGLPLAWLPTNLPRYAKRTYATGLQLTFGNISGVMSPFLYPNSEGPRFVRGNAVTLGMVAFAGIVYGFMWVSYRIINKRRAQGLEDEKISSLSEQDIQEMGDRNPSYRTGDTRRKTVTVGTVTALEDHLTALDSHDPATGTTVVLSPYQTWARRTTTKLDGDGNVILPTPRPRRSSRLHTVDPQMIEDDYDEDHVTNDELGHRGHLTTEVGYCALPITLRLTSLFTVSLASLYMDLGTYIYRQWTGLYIGNSLK
ncbi:Major facilitator superfamily domain, general substrate transporter [Penicillium expansum]|uniref:Major facilitator superfamily domain, general substrate transporter n=1 Tax=Penicillium expansum TaxID=27334 RepID=A0A0A2IZ27_PENEN|nr:Major facilitator superfamily domain, general substrate transporter [Penicillium expansum]KGO47786.1 Major facilitator superfamily domain, general substrate transporter [Penicillium expansum]KGO50678.1 Major facilitator superfamily domain, general substrate transporter [Penicillium expansum]UPX44818.1 hypothetical protein FAC5A24_10 [Penicillium camemberti]